MEKLQIQKLIVGGLLLVVGISLVVNHRNTPDISDNYTFESEPVIVQGFDVGEEPVRRPIQILIPQLGVDIPVENSKIVNGYWEVFQNSAGWGEGSGVPGENGNQVIFAHAQEGLFKPLKNIIKGEKIYILTDSFNNESDRENIKTWYSYEVVEIREVYPYETDAISPSDDEKLTLYTCSGFGDEKRLIVVAKRYR